MSNCSFCTAARHDVSQLRELAIQIADDDENDFGGDGEFQPQHVTRVKLRIDTRIRVSESILEDIWHCRNCSGS